MCVRRFINTLPVSSHTYTQCAGGWGETLGEEKHCFVLCVSGNKRRMGAVTSERDRMKVTEVETKKKGNKTGNKEKDTR